MNGRKARTKKLNVKTPLIILTQDEIDPAEYESLITESQIATGVDHSEENEYHLQNILKDTGTSNDQEIPVPPPQESDMDYNRLYGVRFSQPSSYIRFSNTVEESIGCPYNMTTEDAYFVQAHNAGRSPNSQLSADDFEYVMDAYESTVAEQTASPTVEDDAVNYELMVPALNQLGSSRILRHAKAIFAYWKSRRKELEGKPLHPSLKVEINQETDDLDPYVCFRRREARQTRKTRARGLQMAEKLKRLRRELEEGRKLILLTQEREIVKRELLMADRLIFEHRTKLKEVKVRLSLRGDDEDLVNQKVSPVFFRARDRFGKADQTEQEKPKRKASEGLTSIRAPVHLRISVRNESRSSEADLQRLADKQAEKENEWRAEVEIKKQNHLMWNENYVDLTRWPLSPVQKEPGMELHFRLATRQYPMTPPASAASDAMDIDVAESPFRDAGRKNGPVVGLLAGRREDAKAETSDTRGQLTDGDGNEQPEYRRRIGRLNRLWIDRRGVTMLADKLDQGGSSEQWKFDQDDDGEPAAYDFDPFSVPALKFRALIPLPALGFSRRLAAQANGTAGALLASSSSGSAAHAVTQNGSKPVVSQPAAGVNQNC